MGRIMIKRGRERETTRRNQEKKAGAWVRKMGGKENENGKKNNKKTGRKLLWSTPLSDQ